MCERLPATVAQGPRFLPSCGSALETLASNGWTGSIEKAHWVFHCFGPEVIWSLLLIFPRPRGSDVAPPKCRTGVSGPGNRGSCFSLQEKQDSLQDGYATPPKSKGLQTPCPSHFHWKPQPITISTRISHIRNSATEQDCHPFVL